MHSFIPPPVPIREGFALYCYEWDQIVGQEFALETEAQCFPGTGDYGWLLVKFDCSSRVWLREIGHPRPVTSRGVSRRVWELHYWLGCHMQVFSAQDLYLISTITCMETDVCQIFSSNFARSQQWNIPLNQYHSVNSQRKQIFIPCVSHSVPTANIYGIHPYR